MSLSEKLEQAKKQRLLKAGLLNSAEALKPEPAPVLEDPVWSPVVEVEVQPIGLHSVIDDDEERFLSTMTATHHCPSCHSPGRVDMVDLVGHRTHLTCAHCGAMWHVSSDDSAEKR